MNKTDFLKAVALETGMSFKNVSSVADAMTDVILETLKAGEDVRVFDGVIFDTVYVEERTGRNPSTGEIMNIPAHTKPKCKFGKKFKEALR